MRNEHAAAPDAAAMERLLAAHPCDPTGTVLALAWRAGLTRREIAALTWDRVDLDAMLLRLPDREVPVEPELGERLRQWRARCARFGPWVAISDRRRQRLSENSLSRMARLALDAEGQRDVRLLDLRYDYIRRQSETHDRAYVLRVSGLPVTAVRGLPRPESSDAASAEGMEDAFKLWRVLQTERDARSAAGTALWLSTQAGLRVDELTALTWDMVDLDAVLLRLPEREVPLTAAVVRVLAELRDSRRPGDDPHVLLTPRSRKPMRAAWLSAQLRTALDRGGLGHRTLRSLRRDDAREGELRRLLAHATERGAVTRREAAALLGLSTSQAYARLSALAERGQLVRVGMKYYPAGRAVPPERQRGAVRAYLAENGPAYCQDVAELLGIDKRAASRLLRRMTEDGTLLLLPGARRYMLNDNEET